MDENDMPKPFAEPSISDATVLLMRTLIATKPHNIETFCKTITNTTTIHKPVLERKNREDGNPKKLVYKKSFFPRHFSVEKYFLLFAKTHTLSLENLNIHESTTEHLLLFNSCRCLSVRASKWMLRSFISNPRRSNFNTLC